MTTYLIAPDSFKGSLEAHQFCQIAENVIQQINPQAKVISRPMSDGGEGFVDSFIHAGVAERQSLWVSGPLGRRVKANFAWQADSKTAIIEMAQASGITKVRREELNPLSTHSFGTGQLIEAAIELGAENIILGLGGSATNDGGAGALMALGIEMLDANNKPIGLGGRSLSDIAKIAPVPSKLKRLNWKIACDVTNPLLGEDGATAVFGPQKGATTEQLNALENAMHNYANVLEQHSQKTVRDHAGAGAAGGMAAGFMALFDAELVPGFELLQQTLQLNSLLEQHQVDWIITGEGRMDEQTRFGKLPLRIAQLGQQYQVPSIAICGSLGCGVNELPEFKAIFSIVNQILSETEAMQHAPYLLEQTLSSIIALLECNASNAEN
ncbi:glycerate kinase [Thiomicrorhabdus sediminis]|uniref:Glycerate kinase n=1 Tax=Thiomicrorhabdus sediminis TaxID=2580412 RepID=A0A4P9K550_9GAMM|nr:glycerate kinase [Thiomicrorhabdus sediminis]QCU89347.1 glycerate kinase [Thiomicrorhabdus sediminis]